MRRWRLEAVALLGLVAAGGACISEPLGTDELSAAITGGQLDTGHPAVGVLRFTLGGDGTGSCTGTLVGKQTVLAAAHCLGYPNTNFILGSLAYPADKSVRHPSFKSSTPYLYDLGVVLLKSAPGSVEPMTLSNDPPLSGTSVTLVGFGETTQGAKDNGVKRKAVNTIAKVAPLYFTVTGSPNACYGDSGGPAIASPQGSELVLGVMSYITGACGTELYATRLDLYLSWIKSTAGGDVHVAGAGPEPAPEAHPGAADRGVTDARPEAGPIGQRGEDGCSASGQPRSLSLVWILALLALLSARRRGD